MPKTPSVKRALAEYSRIILGGGTSKRRKRARKKLLRSCRMNIARAHALMKDADHRSASQRRVPPHRQPVSRDQSITRRLPPRMLIYATM